MSYQSSKKTPNAPPFEQRSCRSTQSATSDVAKQLCQERQDNEQEPCVHEGVADLLSLLQHFFLVVKTRHAIAMLSEYNARFSGDELF
jgi:hypothetical protein